MTTGGGEGELATNGEAPGELAAEGNGEGELATDCLLEYMFLYTVVPSAFEPTKT